MKEAYAVTALMQRDTHIYACGGIYIAEDAQHSIELFTENQSHEILAISATICTDTLFELVDALV